MGLAPAPLLSPADCCWGNLAVLGEERMGALPWSMEAQSPDSACGRWVKEMMR